MPGDCVSGELPVCGNGICEIGAGETCRTCSADCNGVLTGAPSGRYCCGDTVDCGDSRCTGGDITCSTDPGGSYCCGDGSCDPGEDGVNCAVDCDVAPFCGDGTCDPGEDSVNCPADCTAEPFCGDGTCDPGEDQCNCSGDCGAAPGAEIPNDTCTDGIDNDCGGGTDCADSDCDADPACACLAKWEPCTVDSECCSNWCHRGACK